MTREFPVIWVIGATRSCKTALAEHGIAPLGFQLFSTGDYFRERFGEPDTYSRDFVFRLSAFAATSLAAQPDCHLAHLQKLIAESHQPCVIEGCRDPLDFAKLYDPTRDMAVILKRQDMEPYDTAIERGLEPIEKIVRWSVNTGMAPKASAFMVTFGAEEIKVDDFGINNRPDTTAISGKVPARKLEGTVEDRYPWIGIVIHLTQDRIKDYYGSLIKSEAQCLPAKAPTRPPASAPQA